MTDLEIQKVIDLAESDELQSKINFDKLVHYIIKNDCGYCFLDNDIYFIAVDGGKMVTDKVNLSQFLDPHNKAVWEKVNKFIVKKELAVCPTTYLFFTNLKFDNWFDSDKVLYKLIKSNHHYNFLGFSFHDIPDERIAASNEKRTYLFASKVSNEVEKRYYDKVYKQRIEDTEYFTYTIVKYDELLEVFDDARQPYIPIILPKNNIYKDHPKFKGKEKVITLEGMKEATNSSSGIYFVSEYGASCEAYLYKQIEFDEFYDLECSLDLLNVFEALRPFRLLVDKDELVQDEEYVDEEHTLKDYQVLFFYAKKDKEYCFNSQLECFKKRKSTDEVIYEDRMVADIYTAIPVKYDDLKVLYKYQSKENNFLVNNLVTGLNFQENFEFGNENRNVKKFHDRILYFDLGTLNILITEEPHYNYYKKALMELVYDKSIPVRLVLLVDKETHTGVLNLVNLGVKYHPTKYLDEISRNTIIFTPTEEDKQFSFNPKNVIDQEFTDKDGYVEKVHFEYMSLYNFIRQKFQIKMVSTPRSLILSPFLRDDKDKPENIKKQYKEIKGSLLYGKTLYTDAEELGKLVDKNLDNIFKSNYGDSVYDYAVINQSKIAVLQYDNTYKDYIVERIDFAVVSLFYLELIMLEESAVSIASNAISEFVDRFEMSKTEDGKKAKVDPSDVFETIDALEEEYTKSIDFWNPQGNYHTTNIAYQSMRNAFNIDESIKKFERNEKQIKQIYTSKQQASTENANTWRNIFMLIFSLTSVYEAIIGTLGSENLSLFRRITNFLINFLDNLTYLGFALIVIGVKIILELVKIYKKKKFKDNHTKAKL